MMSPTVCLNTSGLGGLTEANVVDDADDLLVATKIPFLTEDASTTTQNLVDASFTHLKCSQQQQQEQQQDHRIMTLDGPLSWDTVQIGCLLGTGTFSSVHKVTMLSTATRTTILPATAQYALKRLQERPNKKELSNSSAAAEANEQEAAAADLVLEAQLLMSLPLHNHIVQLHGVSSEFWEHPAKGFMVLDRLVHTLHFRLCRLKTLSPVKHVPASHRKRIGFFNRAARQRERRREQQGRIKHIAVGVARAMDFLHSHSIIYRDLKPQNVGFDEFDQVKVFDFGLSRKVTATDKGEERRLTGNCGTARYMAPEVAKSERYCFSSDVHSFAVMLWEICALERPYAAYDTLDTLLQKAVHGNARPALHKIASPDIKELLKIAWHEDPSARPSFRLVVGLLEKEAARPNNL